MANQNNLIQYALQNGNINPEPQDDKKNEWQRILAMLSMSDKMDWQTMAGFGLGKLLRDYAINQRDKVVTRGNIKNQLFTSNDPKEIQDMLEAARKQGESYYQRLMSEGAERGLPWANPSTQPTPETPASQPAQMLLGYADKLANNANQPIVNQPFQAPSDDYMNQERWEDYIRRAIQQQGGRF